MCPAAEDGAAGEGALHLGTQILVQGRSDCSQMWRKFVPEYPPRRFRAFKLTPNGSIFATMKNSKERCF